MGLVKKKLTVNFPFAAHFNYFPLVWMIHRRFNNNRGKYLHETYPQLIYSDKTSSYEELLDKDESVSIHEGLLQVDCESGIKILSKSYFGRLSYKKQKIKEFLQMTCYFVFRMQKQHKIILLSSKCWVKYGWNIGNVWHQPNSRSQCLQKTGNFA